MVYVKSGVQLSPSQSPSQSSLARPTDAMQTSQPGSPRVSEWLKAIGCRALNESAVPGCASIDFQADSFEKSGYGGRGYCSSGSTPAGSPCCSQPASAAGRSPAGRSPAGMLPGMRIGASPCAYSARNPNLDLLPAPRIAGHKRGMPCGVSAPTAKGWEADTRRAAPLGTAACNTAGLTTLDLSCESFERQCLGPSAIPSSPGSKHATPPEAKQTTWHLQRTPPRAATGWAIARRPV